jgi:hypothetical protein
MKTVALPRVALVLALVVLAGSLAVFASTIGLVSATADGGGHEFAIEDGRLVETSNEADRTLIADIGTVERIEISDLGADPVITTVSREPAELPPTERERAKQIVTTEATIADAIDTPADAVYTIRPIPSSVGSERAAIVGVDPETAWDRLPSTGNAGFTVRDGTPPGTVVLERTGPRMSDRRALVVIDPIERDIRYSLVVDLKSETVDAFVRLREASG